jgi:hypothetical protein
MYKPIRKMLKSRRLLRSTNGRCPALIAHEPSVMLPQIPEGYYQRQSGETGHMTQSYALDIDAVAFPVTNISSTHIRRR